MVIATLVFLTRAVRLWRAVRRPARRYRAHLLYSYGKFNLVGSPWLSIMDYDGTWYQRVMWEPWVTTLNEQAVVEARRVGHGPLVVDVPGYGRLWPVGRARRREPMLTNLVRRHPNRYRLSRFSSLILLTGLMVLLTGPLLGVLGAVAAAGYTWLLVVYVGAGPAAVPFLRPRRYPRIPGLRSFTPTDKPAPLPQPFPRRPRRRR